MIEPVEGLPGYLATPVFRWVQQGVTRRFDDGLYRGVESHHSLLRNLQLTLRLDPPLSLSQRQSAAQDLLARIEHDAELALDVVDYLLAHVRDAAPGHPQPWVAELDEMLRLGGSVWEVAMRPDQTGYELARRSVGPVREVIDALPPASRAHQHLVVAWNKLVSRNPDPSAAYREAVRAVEAAAKPIVTPNDTLATLGKIIGQMKAKPDKWETTLGSVPDVVALLESVWKGQLDRHGTDDDTVPFAVTPEEADAAVNTSLLLSRLFLGGHVRAK